MPPIRPTRTRRAAALVMGIFLLASCNRSDRELTRVGVIGDRPALVATVNSPLSTGDAILRSSLAQGLVRLDARGQVIPGVAERWNVSDDGLSYIFRLQTGNWPDGRRIRAQDVARILSVQLRRSSANPLRDTLGAVSEIVAMTDRVVEIRLIAPRPNLLVLLTRPELGLIRGDQGTGPFQLVGDDSATEDSEGQPLLIQHRLTTRNGEDIRERVILTGEPAHALVAGFDSGRVDIVMGGTFDDLPVVTATDIPRGSLRFDPAVGLFGLKPTQSAIMQDADVRRLISRAIDRKEILARFQVGGLSPRATILQPGLEEVPDPVQPEWLSQAPSARRDALIAEANRLFGNDERPTIRIDMPQGTGGDLVIAQIARDLEPLGIKVGRSATRAGADLVWVDEVAPSLSPAWFVRQFRCAVAPVCLPELEPVLAEARTTLVPRERALRLLEASQQMDEAQLFIPIAAPIRWNLVRSGIDGFIENPLARHTLVGLKDRRVREEY